MLTLCREWVRICCLSAFQNESVAIFMRTSRKNIQKSQRKFPLKSMTYQSPLDSACIIPQMVYYNSITKRERNKNERNRIHKKISRHKKRIK